MPTLVRKMRTAQGVYVYSGTYSEPHVRTYLSFLTKNEKQYIAQLNRDKQKDSLIGRVVAKHAICAHMKHMYNITIAPTTIEIMSGGKRPVCAFIGAKDVYKPPLISIAHTQGTAVVIVADPRDVAGIGIDIEKVREWKEGTLRGFLTDDEYVWCKDKGKKCDFFATVYWCIKESYLKAVGVGLCTHPQTVAVYGDIVAQKHVHIIVGGVTVAAQVDWTQKSGGYIISTILIFQ